MRDPDPSSRHAAGPDAPPRRTPDPGGGSARSRLLPVLTALLLAACGGGGGGGDLPVLYETPDFALTDQSGDTLRASALEGQAWVLHPFFTSCRNVCPATTRRMAALRDSLAADGLLGDGVRLISISVDPARDTTAALRRWAETHGGSPAAHWAFLRGEPPARVRSLVQEGFHLSAMMPPSSDTAGGAGERARSGDTSVPSTGGAAGAADTAPHTAGAGYQVIHASQVLLVDRRGRVRGSYEILRPAEFTELVADTRRLTRDGG